MRKYIFLFILLTNIVTAWAQSYTHTWIGTNGSDDWSDLNNWDCSPNSATVPDGDSIVKIPSGVLFTYPKLVADVQAKTVIIEANALLDISSFSITKTGSYPCQIINEGTLKLVGTTNQKAWFNTSPLPSDEKISLKDNCTVEYYGTSSSNIFEGPYKNLTLSRSVSATRLIVENTTKIAQVITITADNQQYVGKVEAEENATFAAATPNGSIEFKYEVIAKNNSSNTFKTITITNGNVTAKEKITANKLDVSGVSFLAEKEIELKDSFEGKSKNIAMEGLLKAKNINIANSCDEWTSDNIIITNAITQNGKAWKCEGVVQAKNINVGASNWTSSGNIIVEESILADSTNWEANSGNISFKKNLTASKLEQSDGKIIANGTGAQNIKTKKIKELEVMQTSISDLVSLNPTAQTIEKIVNNGTFRIPVGTNVTIVEIENKATATFTSNTTPLILASYINNAGTANISSLKLLPTGEVIKLEGSNLADKTAIAKLSFEGAGGKTLKIKNKIDVSTELKLKGSSKTSLLKVEGENGAISVSSSLTGEGEFLTVKTNIPIENGTYKTKNSQPEGSESDLQAGKPENWIFTQSLLPLKWKGGAIPVATDWNNRFNWVPAGEPDEETETIIPSGRTNYPSLTANVKAKEVTIEEGGELDLSTFVINTASGKMSKISNRGMLKLEGTSAQKPWFTASNAANKIVLENGSTVSYYGGSTDDIFIGPYKKLKLSRNITANSLTVEETTNIAQAITITANDQKYYGKVEAEEDVSFATNADNKTIIFFAEVIAKNTRTTTLKTITITKGDVTANEKITANKMIIEGKAFLAKKGIELVDDFEGKSKKIEIQGLLKAKNVIISLPTEEWVSGDVETIDDITQNGKEWKCNGVVQTKNITVGSSCTKWTSSNNITARENIVADSTDWKASAGDISVKQDLTASKLEQTGGNIIANGNAAQNIKAKIINEIQVVSTSNTDLVVISPPTPQKIGKITNEGTVNIASSINLTVEEIENSATFISNSEITLTETILNSGTLIIPILKLAPTGDNITIEGDTTSNHTMFAYLVFENANAKTLEVKNDITILGHLKLSGADATHVLTLKGPGKIHIPSAFSDKGKFLHVHTNLPLEGATCTTEKSKPIGMDADIIAGKPENWIFDDAITPLKWVGAVSTSWMDRENWRPKGLPFEETETIIPANKANYPIITASDDPKAKEVTIEEGGELDLSTFVINTASGKMSKISNRGMLKLEGTSAQKPWFTASNAANKIVLENGSTVSYYGGSTDDIFIGPYKKLKLSRNITANSLTVEETTNIAQAITITANDQKYYGKVEAEEDVSFATNADNKTIIFFAEVIAKNTRTTTLKTITITKGDVTANEKITANKMIIEGKAFLAKKGIELVDDFEGKSKKIEIQGLLKAKNVIISLPTEEWVSGDVETIDDITQNGKEWKCNGVVQTKNITVGSSCTKWTSSNNITARENIVASTTSWNATNGVITVSKDCNAPKLVQSQGTIALNGIAGQRLNAKTIDSLEIRNTSSSDKVELNVEKTSKLILHSGKAVLFADIILTKEFSNNGGIFDATENEKLVTLQPQDTLTIRGKTNISGNPNPPVADTGTKFYKLHCNSSGGKTLHFTKAIEVLNDISSQPGFIAPPNPNFTQDDVTLVLEGSSATSKLNITGDGQIWLNGTPPYPKPKKGGKFLHVASGVQIRGGCYRVINSTHEKPSPRNWIFEEYAQIVSTLVITGTDELCLTFSRPVAKPVADSLKITSPSFPDMKSIAISSYPKGSNLAQSKTWFFKFPQNFTPEMLLEKQAVVSLGDSSLDFIFESENSDAYPFKKGYISDIGLNLVTPILAKNTKQIEVFDGSKAIPFINTSLFVEVPSSVGSKTLKLYADSDTSFGGEYWVPNKNNIPWKPTFKAMQHENAGAAAFSIDVGKSTNETKMFILPTSVPQLKINAKFEFMLSYEDLPCARLKDANDIFSFDLWRFDYIGTMLQRAGVTVLNNVINVSRDQQVGIEITTKGAGTLTVQIMTLDGSIVKTFVNDYKPVGNYSYYWNGRNEAGRAVARGMYFIRVSSKGVDEIRKVLVTHD
ncbi:MAG: FlgD immunoglobulin-like domain containing protein [Treponema sp.]